MAGDEHIEEVEGTPPSASAAGAAANATNSGSGATVYNRPSRSSSSAWQAEPLEINRQRHERPSKVSPAATLDASDPQIKQDVLSMMVQYLRSEKLFMSAVVIQDEANMKTTEQQARRAQGCRLRKATLEGDWSMVISLLTKNISRQHHKQFIYAVYRQEYLELIERQEYQKAFAFLNRRLKPMESTAASTPNEFVSLCYLLTCKSVGDADHFRSWAGVLGGREKLGDELARVVEVETGTLAHASAMPPNRLVTLLQQAVAFQIESSRYHPKVTPKAATLARDYRCPAVPDSPRDVYLGHSAGVKCVTFVGEEAVLLASGDGDGNVNLWPTNPLAVAVHGPAAEKEEKEEREKCMDGREVCNGDDHVSHDRGGRNGVSVGVGLGSAERYGSSDTRRRWEERAVAPLLTLREGGDKGKDKVRIWDVASNRDGSRLASSSGDGAVRLWSLPPGDELLQGDGLGSAAPDVYSVAFHSGEAHIVTAGHDRTVRLYDIEGGKEVKVFAGHEAGVLHAVGNPYGNLLVSGGRDSAIKFWDVMSGVCIKTLSQAVGAVTSVDLTMDGMYLLASSRHGPVRTWDVRMGRPLLRYKGHQNTSSSFLRASLGAEEGLVFGGSDDSKLYVWHRRDTQLLHTLRGHTGAVYRGTWSAKQSLLATCSEDGSVRTWWHLPRDGGDATQQDCSGENRDILGSRRKDSRLDVDKRRSI